MAVLGREAILQAIEQGSIAITPFNPDLVGPASVDLTLASFFRVFRKVHEVIEVREDTDYRTLTEKIEVPDGEHILIMPGETVLGITRERLRLGPGLCGWLEGRSRFARLGLMVHISAPFMGPGIDSQWFPAPRSASSCSRSFRAARATAAVSPARRKTPSEQLPEASSR